MANLNPINMDTLGQNFFTEEYVSPRQQFMGYAAGTTAPGSRQRDALYRLQNPLLQQYYLGGLAGGDQCLAEQDLLVEVLLTLWVEHQELLDILDE